MTPGEARILLLDQHERLRKLIAVVQGRAAQFLKDEEATEAFQRALDALRTALVEHNASEEALLEPLLVDADRWGPRRVARMLEEHAGEHALFAQSLTGSYRDVAQRMEDFAEELLAHMAAEERTFLSPAVLRNPPG